MNAAGSFGNVALLPGSVNTADLEQVPSMTGDGQFLYATTNPANNDVSVAARGNPLTTFGTLSLVATVDAAGTDAVQYVLPDHSAIYFVSDRNYATDNFDLYRAARIGGSFQAPQALVGNDINTTAKETAPVVTPDESTLYFASDRSGGIGGVDIYVASRASTSVGFGAPANLAGLNAAGDDLPTWISGDGCIVYLTSQTPTDAGGLGHDIFVATRGP